MAEVQFSPCDLFKNYTGILRRLKTRSALNGQHHHLFSRFTLFTCYYHFFFSISCVFFISAQKTIIIISTHSSFEKAKTALINFNFPHSR